MKKQTSFQQYAPILLNNKEIDASSMDIDIHNWVFKEAKFKDGTPLNEEELIQLDGFLVEHLIEAQQNYRRG